MNQPATILIVDDHEANRETLAALLESAGYRLIEAEDGSSTLEVAFASPPDLILLDVMMPGMDGFEVCRRLRADARTAEVPVIMLTALDDQRSRLTGIEAGADDFVSKPFNRAELRARVNTITRLNRYRRLHEQREQFQWVVENAVEGYVQTNTDDEITFANARARLWLGLPDEFVAHSISFLDQARRSFDPQPTSAWQSWPVLDPTTAPMERLLVQTETAHAQAFFLEASLQENSGGRLVRLVDVTERMSSRRDQRSFLAMVSHKLRTPLNALQGGLEILSDTEGMSAEEIAEFAQMSQEGAERLGGLVEDVIRLAGQSRQPAPEAGVALEQLKVLGPQVAAHLDLAPIAVELDEPTGAARIPCAKETLEWILVELLTNAKKFHPQGAPTIQISATREPGKGVTVSISDDGLTLSSEQLAHAGQPFSQQEKKFTGEVPGLGLGLFHVSATLWQVGGSCRLVNRSPGPGVCVILHWPERASLSPGTGEPVANSAP
ncbi:ATP-binding response regulator [Synoicihabitans lomoniglobus]|uniref:histidine kinase n=1 Tax=Synoicihabitans lomoniglobus TaxID=2909285 RepID=A0AAF0CPV6_9BACT|nr:response regulator [Opitutaceae bacterium LMO-M01]WED65860.1 response regulator [Opitutaceae bacterium LMO-M01]